MYALNLAEDGRILSACVVLPNREYDVHTLVPILPEGNISDYLYVNDRYIYDPLPEPETPESELTLESRVGTLETDSAEMKEALELLLSGVTE